uniref:Methyltransferase 15, mitochondrial 12S rRNA N4-cytidine n=1 Tax=Callithrix jacchus TaxID=9483 RepID=A0A8I3VZ80_CALJA
MLRYPYFCRMHKEYLSCWLESGIPNLAVWSKRIHTTAEKCKEYEAHEQTYQTQAQESHRSQDRNFETMVKLHIPVMVDEVVHCLSPQKGQIFLDMTFGSGGHTKAILQKESDIVLYALDRDPTAYALAEHLSELYPKQIRAMLGRFSQAETLLMKAEVQPGTFDGVLMDLGCSSMQLDTSERGFSLRKDGPLDMRMDGDRYPDMPTAADVVNALDQQALASILRAYGEEKHAKKIASAIVQARSIYPITRTQQLASIIAGYIKHSHCSCGVSIYKKRWDKRNQLLKLFDISYFIKAFPPSKLLILITPSQCQLPRRPRQLGWPSKKNGGSVIIYLLNTYLPSVNVYKE